MCVNARWITNPYTGDKFFAKCGHCPACLQEKAISRTNRIRRESASSDKLVLFITLTYDQSSAPFILQDDVDNKVDVLPVYREYSTFWNPQKQQLCRKYKRVKLTEVFNPDYYGAQRCTWLKKRPHKIGVCYFKDIQDFEKRLRINLQRKYEITEKLKFFNCTEYGSHTKRPHAHLLAFVSAENAEIVKRAVVESWPFADRTRTFNYCELVRSDASSYVSSYVNCGASISPFLAKHFKSKHSYSKDFGTNLNAFSLANLLKQVDRGTLQYSVSKIVDGLPQVSDILIPKYVINRFFPLFKGYSRLTCDEIFDCIRTSGCNLASTDALRQRFSRTYGQIYNHQVRKTSQVLDYSTDDLMKIYVRLENAYKRYHDLTGKNRYDFAIDYERVWRTYRSQIYRQFVTDDLVPTEFKYDNIHDVRIGVLHGDYPLPVCSDNPNEFPQNINKTVNLTKYFELYDKEKKVNNQIMASNGHFV